MAKNKRKDSVEIYLPENFTAYLTPIVIIISAIMISGSLIYSANRVTGTSLFGKNDSDIEDPVLGESDSEDEGGTDENSPPDYQSIYSFASELGVDEKDLKSCVDNEDFADEIKKDMDDGVEAGVQGTPGFVIGKLDSNGTVNGLLIAGAYPYETFQAAVNKYLIGEDNDLLADLESASTSIENDPIMGSKNAKVAIVEFSDYECPFCQRHALDVGKQIQENLLGDKVMWVYRDYPLGFHDPVATKEAMIAECVREQAGDEVYYKVHDYIFENTRTNGAGL